MRHRATFTARPTFALHSMSKVLKGLGLLLFVGTVGNLLLEPAEAPATVTAKSSAAAKTTALSPQPSANVKEELAKRELEVAAKLSELSSRVDALLARASDSEGWNAEAIEVAAQFRRFPQSPELTAITTRWRTHPSVVQAYSSELKPLVAAYKDGLPKLLKASRESYQKQADRALLDAGIESYVTIGKGAKGASLRVTSPLVGRVFADRLANEFGMYQAAESAGFYHLVFVNSIDESYITYDLDPEIDMSTRALEKPVLQKWGIED